MDQKMIVIYLLLALKHFALISGQITSNWNFAAVNVSGLQFSYTQNCDSSCSHTWKYDSFAATVGRLGSGTIRCLGSTAKYTVDCSYSSPQFTVIFTIVKVLPVSANLTSVSVETPTETIFKQIPLIYGDATSFEPTASPINETNMLVFGDVVAFNCSVQYIPMIFTSTLQFDATWDRTTAPCEEIICSVTLCTNCIIVDGPALNVNLKYNESATIGCADGYKSTGLTNQTLVTCYTNGLLVFDFNCTAIVTPTAIPAANNTRLKNGPIAACVIGPICLVCCIGCAVYAYQTRDRVDAKDSTRYGERNHEEEKKKKKKQKRKIRLIVLSAFLVLCLILCIVFILLLTVTSESLTCPETDLGQCGFSAAETVGLVLGICIIVALFVVIIADYSCSCCGSFYDLFLTKQNKPEERSMMSNL